MYSQPRGSRTRSREAHETILDLFSPMALLLLATTGMMALPNLFIGNATMVAVDYPVVGVNKLTAGGGGACSYSYSAHDDIPVVTAAKCEISVADIDKGII